MEHVILGFEAVGCEQVAQLEIIFEHVLHVPSLLGTVPEFIQVVQTVPVPVVFAAHCLQPDPQGKQVPVLVL